MWPKRRGTNADIPRRCGSTVKAKEFMYQPHFPTVKRLFLLCVKPLQRGGHGMLETGRRVVMRVCPAAAGPVELATMRANHPAASACPRCLAHSMPCFPQGSDTNVIVQKHMMWSTPHGTVHTSWCMQINPISPKFKGCCTSCVLSTVNMVGTVRCNARWPAGNDSGR